MLRTCIVEAFLTNSFQQFLVNFIRRIETMLRSSSNRKYSVHETVIFHVLYTNHDRQNTIQFICTILYVFDNMMIQRWYFSSHKLDMSMLLISCNSTMRIVTLSMVKWRVGYHNIKVFRKANIRNKNRCRSIPRCIGWWPTCLCFAW